MAARNERIITEWLDEYKALTESEVSSYAAEQELNEDAIGAIYDILSEPYHYKGQNLLDNICQQLLDYYRSGEELLKRFALQFIPILVYLHLSDRTFTSVQTLLLSLYNLEVVDTKGQPRTLSFRVPSVAQSSIYHDHHSLEKAFTDENSLRRLEECNTKLVSWGPLPQLDKINAQNRQRVIVALVFLYNQQLSCVGNNGLDHACRAISRLVSQGFHVGGSARSSVNSDSSFTQGIIPRICVSSTLLLELLHTVYHAAHRGITGARQTLDDLQHRALYESYPEVLLASNAINNLLHHSQSTTAAPRPSQTRTIAKSMITNASFRTKKLPDDIDIPIQESQADQPLDSITEEQDGGGGGSESGEKNKSKALKLMPKIPGLGKKHKSKNVQVELQPMEQTLGAGDAPQIDPAPNNDQFNHAVHVSAV